MKKVQTKMHVKKGDKVKVITGSNKGKEGEVIKALISTNKIVVSGVNIVKKHKKATNKNEKGQMIEMSLPIDASNVKKI
jgi:large subunit ribosomal protein L24